MDQQTNMIKALKKSLKDMRDRRETAANQLSELETQLLTRLSVCTSK